MTPAAVLVTVIAYFLVLYLVASLSGRRADNQGFFVGNRRSPWPVVAFAMIGSSISGVTFVSVPGWVQASQFSYLQMALGFVVGQLVIAFVLIPLFYRMGLVSIYQYLESRFGIASYRTGAWFFFLSKMIGAAVRVYLVCLVMQLLVFGPLHVPFVWNVAATMVLVWLYTYRGGVKSLIWTDSLKTFCLVASVGLCIYFIASDLHLGLGDAVGAVAWHDYSRIFFFDDLNDRRYFFKQFLAGAFTVIAMTGLDQDMMQRNLSCRNYRDSQKNIVTSGLLQLFVILLFLVLGVLLYLYAERSGIRTPERSDELFPMIATGGYFPAAVGVLFVIGLVSSAYSAAGSALTALTTSFTVDILRCTERCDEARTARVRKRVHAGMAATMGVVILVFGLLNDTSVIDAVYTLASYTYGPILGLFAFGIFTRRSVRDRWIPLVAVLSPVLCYVLQCNSERWFGGYSFSYELLIFNALFTFVGLCLLIVPGRRGETGRALPDTESGQSAKTE